MQTLRRRVLVHLSFLLSFFFLAEVCLSGYFDEQKTSSLHPWHRPHHEHLNTLNITHLIPHHNTLIAMCFTHCHRTLYVSICFKLSQWTTNAVCFYFSQYTLHFLHCQYTLNVFHGVSVPTKCCTFYILDALFLTFFQ